MLPRMSHGHGLVVTACTPKPATGYPECASTRQPPRQRVLAAMTSSGHGTTLDRVTNVPDFIGTLERIVSGDSVVDPVLVRELVTARRAEGPLDTLSARERDVLALMAEGQSNAGISQQLWVTEGTVEKHVRSILMKLRLPKTDNVHRRVMAVLAFLNAC